MPRKKTYRRSARRGTLRKPGLYIIFNAIYWITSQFARLLSISVLIALWLIKMAFLIIWYFGIGFIEGAVQGYKEYRAHQDSEVEPNLMALPERQKITPPSRRISSLAAAFADIEDQSKNKLTTSYDPAKLAGSVTRIADMSPGEGETRRQSNE